MANYEQELEKLWQDWKKEQDEYAQSMNYHNSISSQRANQFNSLVTIINTERHLMRREINTLYNFLKQFGDIGEKITLFDFSPEDWLFANPYVVANTNIGHNTKTKKFDSTLNFMTAATLGATGIGGVASSASFFMGSAAIRSIAGAASLAPAMGVASVAVPMLGPISLLPLAANALKKNKDKKLYLEQIETYEKDSIRMKNEIAKSKEIVANYTNLVTIADFYRIIVASVRDTITDVIISELNGITVFLYADAIKNCIINGDDPEDAEITKISEYKNTPYHSHYIFVKNVFDYYTLISKIFREPILSNLVKQPDITESKYKEIEDKLKSIDRKQNELAEISMFGGEV